MVWMGDRCGARFHRTLAPKSRLARLQEDLVPVIFQEGFLPVREGPGIEAPVNSHETERDLVGTWRDEKVAPSFK